MRVPTSDPRHSGQRRSRGLIMVSTGFLAAVAAVIAIGITALGLVPPVQ